MKFVMQMRENIRGILKRRAEGAISLWKKSIKFFNMRWYVWLANLSLGIFNICLNRNGGNIHKVYYLFIVVAILCILGINFKSRLEEIKYYKDYILDGKFVSQILPLDILMIFLSLCLSSAVNGLLFNDINESYKAVIPQVCISVSLVVIHTRFLQYMLIGIVYDASKTIISMWHTFLILCSLIFFWVILPDNIIGEAIIFVGSYKLFEWYFSEDRIYARYYTSRKKWKKVRIPRHIKLKRDFLKSLGTLSFVSLLVSNAIMKKVFQVLTPREFGGEVNVIQRLMKDDTGEAFLLYLFYSMAVIIVSFVLILIFICTFKIYFKSSGDS